MLLGIRRILLETWDSDCVAVYATKERTYVVETRRGHEKPTDLKSAARRVAELVTGEAPTDGVVDTAAEILTHIEGPD